MKKAYFKILILCFLHFAFRAYAQNSIIDSLQKDLQTQKAATNKVNTLILSGNNLFNGFSYYKNSFEYLNQAGYLSEKLNFARGQENAYYNITYFLNIDSLKQILQTNKEDTAKVNTLNILSKIFTYRRDLPNALLYSQRALSLAEKIHSKAGIAQSYETLGGYYRAQENAFESLRNYYTSLRLCEEIGHKKQSAICLFWIGFVYYFLQEDYQRAHNAFSNGLKIYRQIGTDNFYYAQCYIFLGNIYRIEEQYEQALKYVAVGLKMSIANEYKQAAANAYLCIGDILSTRVEHGQTINNKAEQIIALKEARKSYLEAVNNFRAVGDIGGAGDSYERVAEMNIKLHQFSQAQKYVDSALLMAKGMDQKDNFGKSYLVQAKLDSAQSNFKQAYKHYKLYTLYRDSILNEETKKKSLQASMQYEFDKKQSAARADHDKKDAIATAEIKNQKLIRNFSIAGAVAVLIFSVYSFSRYQKKKKLQNEQALMNERLRISRELHDEVGATLSGIAMYSHLTKEQIKNADTTQVEKSLNIMQQSAGEMVNKLNDIVWLVNPDQDSLQKLIQRLEEYATDMAMIKNMQVKVNAPEHLHEHSLPMESRRNIYLFCKEAINNAVKYSNGTILELNIKEENGTLEFSVSDNGKGFDAVTVRRGNGLENMQKRADEIGAKLTVQSKEGEGTLVSMQVKITL